MLSVDHEALHPFRHNASGVQSQPIAANTAAAVIAATILFITSSSVTETVVSLWLVGTLGIAIAATDKKQKNDMSKKDFIIIELSLYVLAKTKPMI